MKTYEFKNTLFNYFNNKLIADYPKLVTKIFRERLKINKPEFPFVVMKSGERTRINKRFEKYETGAGKNIRVQYRLPITFEVHDLRETPMDAEKFSDEMIDYIEQFFINNDNTHNELRNLGIVVNELMCSGVRDTSSVSVTAQEFVKEIDIVFEFEDVKTESLVPAEGIVNNIVFFEEIQK